MNIDELRESGYHFYLTDYLVLLLTITGSALFGLYSVLKRNPDSGNGQPNTKKTIAAVEDAESFFLGGGRNMRVLPISMSLIMSFISGIAVLGAPTEVYLYGTKFLFMLGSLIISGFVLYYFFLPVYYDMQLITVYEYLETRFSKRVRKFGSLLFTFGTTLYLPIVIYTPALALNQVSGMNIYIISSLSCLLCVSYTCVGGLKAVVCTDVLQTLVMFGAMIVILVKGTIDIGGPTVVFQKAQESGRIEAPSFKLDFKERFTFYSVFIGSVAHWLISNANQSMTQRYLSLPTLTKARNAMWYFIGGLCVFFCVCGYIGLLMYATYSDCDPLQTKLAQHEDQVFPLFVMRTVGKYPGLPGLFVAGVFSAGLSSLASGFHSISTVLMEDFVKPSIKKPLTDHQATSVMRGFVVIFGAICAGLVYVVDNLGEVLNLTNMLASAASGPLLGVFTAGVMVPWIEETGALVGGISSLVFIAWMCVRAQADLASGAMVYPLKPFSTQGCNYTFSDSTDVNILTAITETTDADEPFHIYNISYFFYTMLGSLLTIFIALIVSFSMGRNKLEDVDTRLLSPLLRLWIERKRSGISGTKKEKIYAKDSHHQKYPSVSYEGVNTKEVICKI